MTLGVPVEPKPVVYPEATTLDGSYVTLIPIDSSHAELLYPILNEAQYWTYLGVGPFNDATELGSTISNLLDSGLIMFGIVPKVAATGENAPSSGTPLGFTTLMSFSSANRTVEIGWNVFSSYLQRTTASTEAIYLLLTHAFEVLNCRRVEWKCHAGNTPSSRAAKRYGFVYEGKFRNHQIVKGRNRDSLWFSIIDEEWEGPTGKKRIFKKWLTEDNFDDGKQRRKMEEIRKEVEGDREGKIS